MATTSTKKATRSYTTTKGERVTKYSDGSEKRVPASSGGSTSSKTVSYGTNAKGAPLESTGSKLRTKEGQSLKDYSIAFAGGGSGKGVTSDSSEAKNSENQLRTDIGDQLKKLQKDQERQIAKERAALADRKAAELLNINEDADRLKTDTEIKQAGEVGTTSMALARAGGYLGETASHRGVLQNLADTQRRELATLENSRQDALRAANNAYEDRDFELAREKLQIARDTEQEIYNRQQEFDRINREEQKKVQDTEKKAAVQASIFSAIDGGATDVQSIFEALGGNTTVEEINSVLNAIKPKSGDGFNFSSSDTASLLGTGLSKDDIQALNDFINENGYTDALRATLTPQQRAAADKIFREVKKVTGSDDPTKPLSILDIQRLEDTYGVLFPLGVTAAEATQFIRDNLGASPAEMQEAIDTLFGSQRDAQNVAGGDIKIEITEDWFRQNLDTKQLKKLADLVGASRWWRAKSMDLFGFINSDIDQMFDVPEFFTLLENKIQQLRDQGISDADILIALTS